MPRITVGRAIEFQFQSPSELVESLGPSLDDGEPLAVPGSGILDPGALVDVVIQVPWLGRHLDLKARVLAGPESPDVAQTLLRLADGTRDSISDLVALVGRLRSGGLLHEAPGDLPAEQRIRAMSPHLRAMFAAHANAEERIILSRESDPRVIDFLLKNTSITIDEVRRIAGKLVLNQAHFTAITRNPAWMGDETLRAILSKNPRLPEFLAESILMTLSVPALKALAESVNATASTRRVAGRILQTRGVVVNTRRGTI